MNATLLHRRAPPVPPAASFYVPQIPLLPPTSASTPPLTVSAGYLPARPPAAGQSGPAGDAHLYFVLERARHVADRRRLIIWFNGGPGCSSFDGLMMEIGPFRPDQKGGIEWTTPGGAWNEYADVLYLDQPVGTGFSYASTSDYAHTLPQAAEEVRYFLQQFVEVYPEYKRGNGVDTYLAGESYAGQYIPFTGAALIDTPGGSPVDLKGIAIGNGFIDPKSQAGSELDMMIEAGIWTKDSNEFKQAYKQVEQCRNAITETKGNPREIAPCGRILHQIIDMTTQKVSGKLMCINIYDVRLSDTSPDCGMNWPPTIKPTYDYLARGDVRKALHVNEAAKPEAWIECNHRVGSALREKDPQSSVVHLPKILDAGVQVLLFAGDQDLICNHIGVERIPANLDWSHAKDWQTQAVKRDWVVNNTAAGYWRTANNLTYVSIADGSHMVGYDKPVQSHDMMLRFMGVDLMGAAGPSARIPSRVEGQPDRMLVVGGGGGGIADDRPMIPGVDGKSEEQVKEEAKWAAYYNAGSAALIILLILVAVGTYVLLRLRRNARGVSLGHGRGGRGRPSALDTEEGEHELEHLTAVNPDDEAEGDTLGVPERGESSAARYNDSQETFRPQRQQLGKRAAVGDDETIFDVGAGSDEDEEDRRP